MEPKIHEPRRCASIPPSGLDGIDVHTRLRNAEHEIPYSGILLERLQLLEDNVVHGNGPSLTSLAPGDENSPSDKVHVFPLQVENLAAPHPRVQSDGDYGTDMISPAGKFGERFSFCVCGNEPLSTAVLLQQAHGPDCVGLDQLIIKSHEEYL